MNYKSGLFCTLITFLLMSSLLRAADLSGIDKLNAFEDACCRAEKASEAASLRQAINSIQKLRVDLGMADNKSCSEYLQALNSRLYAIQQVTTTVTKFTDEEQTAAKNAIEALKSIECKRRSKSAAGVGAV